MSKQMSPDFWVKLYRLERLIGEAQLTANQDEPGIYEQAYAELLRFLIDHAPDSVKTAIK